MRSAKQVGEGSGEAKLRILLLEDVPSDAELIERELRNAKVEFEARRVETRSEFSRAVDEFAPDLVLADYHLPQFDGMSALRLARERFPSIPVIIVTGAVSEEVAVECMKAGADDYLMKDRLARLGAAVRSALDQKREREGRAQAERALQESEAHFRSLIENALDMITLLDSQGTILYQSPSVTRILGYSPAEIIGKKAADFVHPADREEVAEALVRAFAETGTVQTAVSRARHKNGSWRILEMTGRASRLGADQRAVVNSRDITDRERTESALRDSETRFQSVVHSASDAIILADGDGNITFWNEAASRMFGYVEEEVLGEPLSVLIPERYRGPHQEALGRRPELGRTRLARVVQASGLRKDGSQFPIEISLGAWEAGGKPSYVGIVRDITERVSVEAKLRESQERLDLALKSAALGTWDWDVETDEVVINEQWAEMLGYSPDEIETSRAAREKLTHPEDWPLVSQAQQAHLAGRTPVLELEYRLRAKSGEWRWILDKGKVVERGEDGRPLRATGIHQDITERKRANEANARLATALEQVGEGIAITDAKGVILYVNPAFGRITGYSADEALGHDLLTLQDREDNDALNGDIRSVFLTTDVWSCRSTSKRKDGTRYEEDRTITPICDREGTTYGYVAVKRDISKQVELEAQLQQAQKMEAVGRLAGGIAHDFNNLLTVILGNSEVVLSALAPDDRARADVEEIRKAGERAASLTRQLLAFSRRQVLRPKVLNLNSVVSDLEKMLRRVIGEDIEFVSALDPELRAVEADQAQIEQVIMNLALNARDAMPDGGVLTIETDNAEFGEAYTSTHYPMKAGEYVMIAVSDTGCGMNEEVRTRVFEPFFTTKDEGKGTGLGLSTVYGIVKQSGGYVWVYSEQGHGSTFKVYLPCGGASVHPVEDEGVGAELLRGSETILLVEDEGAVRSVCRNALQGYGYTVLDVRDGWEALETCERHSGPIHLMVTDLVMPGLSGWQLAGRVASLRPGMRILYTSGYTDHAALSRGLDGDVQFLQKPFTPDTLARKVREALDATQR